MNVDTAGALELLGCGRTTLNKLRRSGKIKSVRTGGRRYYDGAALLR